MTKRVEVGPSGGGDKDQRGNDQADLDSVDLEVKPIKHIGGWQA
jgi:hypothetical protein